MFGLNFYVNKEQNTSVNNIINLNTLKADLIKNYSFEETLRLVCIHRDMQCFVLIDNVNKKNNPIKLFDKIPEVYDYSLDFQNKKMNEFVFENEDVEEIFFDFFIDRDFKIEEMILFYKDKYYVYNAFNLHAVITKEKEEILNMFEDRLERIKNAFSI